jgi:threonine dehydrogenase-like Zn-dependent dehydrogenase
MQKGDHIVIVGASIVGLLLAQLAMYYQAVPILVDGRQSHLDIASKLGIYYTVDYVNSDPYKKIVSITGGRLSENVVLIGAGGISLSNSLKFVSYGGSLVIADVDNYYDNDFSAVPTIASKQLSLHGISNGLKHFMPSINLLAQKTVSVSQFVSKEIEFSQVEQFLQQIAESPFEHIKVIVKNN